MIAENPVITSEEKIIRLVSEAISNGVAQSACIWEIIRSEIPDYGAPERRKECYARYNELIALIKEKGLYVSEQSQLTLWFQRDVSRILGGLGKIIRYF